MAKKDHTLLEAVDLIGLKFQENEGKTQAELIASAIERIRKNPDRDISDALVYESVLLKDDVRLINEALQEAAPYELQVEVMASTIDAIRRDPELDLSIALQYGLQDWDV